MIVEHHDLRHEFPEHLDLIQSLRDNDVEFAKAFDAYHALTNEIEQIELADVPMDDIVFEEMKKRRVLLKDELYRALLAHKG